VRGICVHRSGRGEQGLALLRRALSIDPGNQEMNMLLAFYARMRNRGDEAYAAFDRWNELNPRSAVGFYIRAEFEQDDARYDDSIRDFHKAIAINPDFGQCVYKLGKLYYNRQNWVYAGKALQRAEKLGSNHDNGVAKLVDCLLRTKQYKEAVLVATKAIELFGTQKFRKKESLEVPGFEVLHESSLLVECQVKRAIAYFYSGDIAKATADLAVVLREHPDNVPALDLSQKIAFKTGNYNSAIMSLNRLIDIDQDVQMWYECRAEAYKKLGKIARADADLKIVDALNKTGRLPD
jgi:tetratricopeptide (TPR) repeat protein